MQRTQAFGIAAYPFGNAALPVPVLLLAQPLNGQPRLFRRLLLRQQAVDIALRRPVLLRLHHHQIVLALQPQPRRLVRRFAD